MSLIAALYWNKSPHCSISTMILNDENFEFVVLPKIEYLSGNYFSFRKKVKKTLRQFFHDIESSFITYQTPVVLEFKIVFNSNDVPYLKPARESRLVSKVFRNLAKKTQRRIKYLTIKPQLRSKLSGKSLKQFKQGLRALYLVSRKRDTGYEYHLWSIALHATSTTFDKKLTLVRKKLERKIWQEVI